MDYRTYQRIRSYCWKDLAAYINTPNNNLALELAGGSAMAESEHELKLGMGLYGCKDLTPQENAAAHLLAVISNHRLTSWWREKDTPDGSAPMPPLDADQAAALMAQTHDAVRCYAVFLPKREAAALLDFDVANQAQTVPVAATGKSKLRKADESEKPTWQQLAKDAADRIYKLNKKIGCDPSIPDIANEIEKEFADKVFTVKGKRLNAGYIKRHGLEGWERPKN